MEDNNSLKEKELSNLIFKMTTTGKSELNFNHCKELKGYCKNSNSFVDIAFKKLWSQLKKPHSEIRLSCVQTIDILFMRSSHFRSLILDNFIEYFQLTMGTEKTLPPPVSASKVLKVQSIQLFKQWHEKFSPAYKQIELAMKYLKECKNINFENIEQNVSNGDDEEIGRVRLNKAVCELEAVSEDICMSIQELENCLNLLLPSPEEFDLFCKDKTSNEISEEQSNKFENLDENEDNSDGEYYNIDDEDYEYFYEKKKENSYRLHEISNRNISLVFNKEDTIKVYESSDNRDLILQLTEKLELLKNKYIVLVRQTLRIYSKYNAESSLVKTASELKVKIQNVINKADKLLIIRKDVDDEDEDDFVEVPLIKPEANEVSQLLELASSSSTLKSITAKSDVKPDTEASTTTQSPPSDTLPFNAKPWTVGDSLPQQHVIKATSSKPVVNNKSIPMVVSRRDENKDYWRDDVLDRKLSQVIGVDLTKDALKRKSRKSGLTDLRKIKKDTGKKRLIKLLNKKKNKKKKN